LESFVTIRPDEEVNAINAVPDPEVTTIETSGNYGKFALEPLERGFAMTLGNPLRRVLLSTIPGMAVTWIKIEGVLHEYSTIPHVKEEVIQLIQRIKTIRLKPLSDRHGKMHLEATGPGDVYASDIAVSSDMEIANPDLYLASLDSPEGKLAIEFNVEHGQGYVPAVHDRLTDIGTLPVDAIFTPVRKVDFAIEHTRVGQFTDYERLVIEIWTDGTIEPIAALKQAALILGGHFARVQLAGEPRREEIEPLTGVAASVLPEIYNMSVENLNLSSRTLNALRRFGINQVGQVLEKTPAELLKIRNFGQKSLNELTEHLNEREVTFPVASDESPEWNEDEPARNFPEDG